MSAESITSQGSSNRTRTLLAFMLVLALSGFENLIAELIPGVELGPIEIGISSFFFVPLVLVILFNSWWAALAAPVGELIFSDLVLGEFGGLGEFEEVILVTVALKLAASLVRNPRDRMQVLIAGLVAYGLAELAGTVIDILKVVIGVEEFEAVEGLPASIVVVEGLDFLVEYVVTGILLGALPAMWLAPRLYGTIEPLLGLQPRPGDGSDADAPATLAIAVVVGVVISTLVAIVAAQGMTLIEWEPEFLESIGEWYVWVAVAISAVVALISGFMAVRERRQP
ncbi:MAG: hypothetical protein KGS47_05125 [Chloroflexi bacterium]|nr:hypothetical protein [Chloroflexota bacterium]